MLANLSCCAYGLRNPFIYPAVDYSSSSSIGKRLGGTAMWSTVEGDWGAGRAVHGQGWGALGGARDLDLARFPQAQGYCLLQCLSVGILHGYWIEKYGA